MSLNNRTLSFSLAINEAIRQMMESDSTVCLIGQGVKSPWYVGNTASGLLEKFGPDRVVDTPVSENAMTGMAVGGAIAGLKIIVVHPRMDFMLYAFDPIVNQAANWHFMSGGQMSVPMVIWGIINRGGEQAAQHSQALYSLFAHVPGLKVVAPATPFDAKGLMIAAIKDSNPVVFIDDRCLYNIVGEVPEDSFSVPIGEGICRKKGKDVTVVATSSLVQEALRAADELLKKGIDIEVIDPRTLKPLDVKLITSSAKKTGRMVVVDGSWKFGGFSAEVAALAGEFLSKDLKSPVVRITLPEAPAPANRELEKEYYISSEKIVSQILDLFQGKSK